MKNNLFSLSFYVYLCCYLVLQLACSNRVPELEGLWVSEDCPSEVLQFMPNNKLIGMNRMVMACRPQDTLNYKHWGNLFLCYKVKDKKWDFVVKMWLNVHGNELDLTIYDGKENQITSTFFKATQKHYSYESLKDPSMKIKLPSGVGVDANVYTEGRCHHSMIFATYKDGELWAQVGDTIAKVNNDFYQLLKAPSDLEGTVRELYYNAPILLVADRHLSYKDFNHLEEQIFIGGHLNIYYLLQFSSYDDYNYFALRLAHPPKYIEAKYGLKMKDIRPLYEFYFHEERPESPDLSKENVMIIKVDGQAYQYADTLMTTSNLQKAIHQNIDLHEQLFIAYDISSTSTYQDFIDFHLLVRTVFEAKRKEYLEKEYGLEQNYDSIAKKAAREHYPMRFYPLKEGFDTNY